LGPGLITGASDDDPSGIATYSQAGAQFGYALTWTMLFTYPLMTAVQIVSARMGRTTGRGIAGNLRQHCPPWLLTSIVLCFDANAINIGADLGAGTARFEIGAGRPRVFYVCYLPVCTPFRCSSAHRVSVLKWLTLVLFAYVASFMVRSVDRGAPSLVFSQHWDRLSDDCRRGARQHHQSASVLWQASQEAEDVRLSHHKPSNGASSG
jgi:hypothetical protein